MAIKKVTPDPMPDSVKISHNCSGNLLKNIILILGKEWKVRNVFVIQNKDLPLQNAIIYDRNDCVQVREENNKIHWRKVDNKEIEIILLTRKFINANSKTA